MSTGLYLFAAFLLVLLNGFFVLAEFALVKVRSTRVAELANEGRPTARMAMHAIHHLDAYLSATQLGITLASIGLGWLGEPAVSALLEPLFAGLGVPPQVLHPVSFMVAFAIVAALHIVLGELAPKSWAIQQPERLTLAIAYPLHWFYWLFRPAIWLLNGMAIQVLRVFRIQPASEHELAHSQEELRMILTASGQSGVLKDSEVDLVKHVFEFADKEARDVMVPRVDMVYMDATWDLQKNLDIAQSHTYTRYPLCEGGPDKVIGMIHIKDLIRLAASGEGDLRTIRREILFVPETKAIDLLLREFQLRKMHMALVVDEYGGSEGLVTLEDVLEEIVGEIHDEFEEPAPEVQPLEEGQFLVDGRVLLLDLKVDYEIDIPPNGSETVGGWVLDKVGAIPEPGMVVETEAYAVEVREMDGQRVRQVLIRALSDHDDDLNGAAEAPTDARRDAAELRDTWRGTS
jgi:CBS domain containing-hemolysin-like protein